MKVVTSNSELSAMPTILSRSPSEIDSSFSTLSTFRDDGLFNLVIRNNEAGILEPSCHMNWIVKNYFIRKLWQSSTGCTSRCKGRFLGNRSPGVNSAYIWQNMKTSKTKKIYIYRNKGCIAIIYSHKTLRKSLLDPNINHTHNLNQHYLLERREP